MVRSVRSSFTVSDAPATGAPPARLLASPALTPRALAWQALALLLVGGGIGWFVVNTLHNLEIRQVASGFGFLERQAGFPIGETLLAYGPADTYARAIAVGILNTLKVAAVGLVLATLVGVLVGVAALARNALLSGLARAYVELLRNTPLLLQLFFWYALMQGLPAPRQSWSWGEAVFLSNRGVMLPAPVWDPAHAPVLAALAGGIAAAWILRRRLGPALLAALALAPALLVWVVAGVPLAVTLPELQGFNFRGGWRVTPEFAALLMGLSLYTAAFIAEIVRAGIQSVPRGQVEAAKALGLGRAATLRLVVLPQALRLMVPPTTSQYLNLVKNSSLAVAIGYPDLVSVINTTISQTGQAIEGVAMIMAAYLTVSLSLSLLLALFDRRLRLVTR